jgi:DNA-binding NarL/FixJ family response regulator
MTEPAPIRVLVVDDHPAVRRAVLQLLGRDGGFHAVAVANGAEAVRAAAAARFDVAVVDYELGVGENGLTVTRDLRSLPSAPRVLLYSMYAGARLAARAMAAGADGMLSKGGPGADLPEAIREIARGRTCWPGIVSPRTLRRVQAQE